MSGAAARTSAALSSLREAHALELARCAAGAEAEREALRCSLTEMAASGAAALRESFEARARAAEERADAAVAEAKEVRVRTGEGRARGPPPPAQLLHLLCSAQR